MVQQVRLLKKRDKFSLKWFFRQIMYYLRQSNFLGFCKNPTYVLFSAPAAPAGEEVAVAKPVKVKQASEENVPAFDEADADRAAEKAGRKAEALNMDGKLP